MQSAREDRWVPVGLVDQFVPESSHPVVIDGFGLAVWCGRDGTIHVWEDRCPHRGMRLSFGFVRDATLTCLYHGWQYAGSGRCRVIPAHPDLDPPKKICARTFETRTHRGIVHANLADDPALPWSGKSAGGWSGVRSVFLAVGIEAVRAELTSPGAALGGPGDPSAVAVPDMHDCYELQDADAGRVGLALQSVEPGKSALHVVCETDDPAVRLALARRVVRLRRRLERT